MDLCETIWILFILGTIFIVDNYFETSQIIILKSKLGMRIFSKLKQANNQLFAGRQIISYLQAPC